MYFLADDNLPSDPRYPSRRGDHPTPYAVPHQEQSHRYARAQGDEGEKRGRRDV